MADNQQYGPLAPKQTSASDIRSVIANATKKSGAGMTIATKDELNQKKVSNTNGLSNKNIVNTTNTKVNPNIAKVNNTKPTSVSTTTKTEQAPQQQGTKMSSLIQGQVSGDLFKNPAVQPINNVKVEQINGKNQNLSDSYVNYHLDKNEIKNMLVETPEEKKKRQSEGVEKLYIDAYRKKKDGGVLTVEDVLGNANYQRELNGIEQGVLQEMVNDANTLANAGKFNMDNAMALFDKYQDLGIQIDYNKLSPESKAQFVGDMLNNKQSTLGKIISWATPMGQISNIKELITGKSMTDDILDTITKLEESSHKNLTDKDTDKIASKQIKKLDEAYKDFYDMGKKAPSLIDYATNIKNVGDLYYKHKYGVDEDQKIWKDKDKEKEYNEELNKIRSAIKEQHGDTAANVARNTLIGSAKALLTVANMASDLPSFGKMIWDLGKGGVEDTVGAIASVGKTAYDTAKYAKDTGDFEVQWDAKDIRQRVAEAGGYDNYNDFVAKVEQEMGGSPLGQFLAWSLKDADTSMNTANALGNYFIEKYGTLDDGLTAFKNDPVEATSDWIPWGQFNVKLLEKLGLISSAKANKIIEASRWMDAYDKPFELVNKFQFGPLLKMEGKLLGGVSKLGLGTINLPFKLVSRAVDAVFSKLTGIDKESRNFIRENPDEVLSYVNGEKTSDGILRDIKDKFDEITDEKRQIGEEYEAIKNNDVPVKSKEILDNIMNTLSEFGVKISDKGVEYTKILPQFVEKNVKELLRFVDDYKKKGETPSASETHYFRQLVDTLAKWESNTPAKGIEAQFINSVKDIRRTIDNALKDQVPGMKEADAAYSAALDTIKELRRDWFDKDGTLKDSAYSRIRNLTNKGSNQPKLERLESVIPGITKQLKSLAVSEVIERGMKQATGQYLNQIASGAGLGAIASLLTGGVSLPTLIIGALGMMYATPENFAHLLRFEGKVTKPIRDIANKISNRTKLTAKETSNLVDFMLDNQERLGKTAQYMYEKGLLEEPMKASDIKAPKSKDPTLKELTEYKESLKKDLKEGKISQKYYDDEIHGKNGEPGIDYAIAQKKARTKIGDKEKVLSAEDKERVTNFIKKRANDVGFVTKMFEHLPYDEGFTVLRDKLIAFSKNPGNTTSQHELFHAFFSVVDNKTKTYLIQEARKILKDNGMAIKDAEEWLAESFGIYAKRKMIDLGMIKNAPKGVVDKFVSTLRNFFQRVYEYMQKFNGDRATINKIFDEVLGEKQMKDGIMDLSDLLGDKKLDKKLLREIELGDNGLRNKSVYHGSPADFDKFDSSHMGEGEGAQAHGWGHYVAVEERTGKHYAEMGKNRLEYKGLDNEALTKEYYDLNKKGEYTNRMGEIAAAKAIFGEMEGGMSFSEAKKTIKDRLEKWTKDSNNGLWKKELEEIDNIKEGDIVKKSGRNLYSLDIPDPVKADTPTGSNYWEEDGKITKSQIDKIYNEVVKEFEKKKEGKAKRVQNLQDGQLRVFKNLIEQAPGMLSDGKGLYTTLSNILGGQKQASKFLESLGYDGIHYYGARDGEAYVIFNDNALQIKEHIRYKKKIGDKDVEINKDITSPEQMAKVNSKGLSVIHDFISEKQAEKALDVSKDILDEDGNAYLWTHTNKYNDKMFSDFRSTRDSKYSTYSNADVAWFTNSPDMSKTYSYTDSKLAPTKKFTNIDDFNKYAEKNKIDDGWKWDRYGDVREIDKTTIAENNGQFIPYTTKTFEYKFNNLFDAYETFNDKDLMKNRWVDRLIGEMPKTEEEAYSKFEEYIKGFENGKVTNKGNKLKDLGASLDVDKIIGYFDNKDDALAESYAISTKSDNYHYQGVAQNLKKPYVVDYSSNKKPQMWNKLGTLKDFAKKEGGKELSKIFDTIDKYQTEKWDILNFLDEGKNALLDKDNHYIDGNMIEEKDYFLGNIQQALRDGTVKLILDSPSWEGEEFAKIKNDTVANGKTFGDLHDMLKKMSGTDDVFYSDFKAMGDLPTVLRNFGVPEATRTLIMQKLVDREFFESAGLSYADRIRIHGLSDLEKKLSGINLETNDYVRYALNEGNYDGVIFKNIVDYGGTPKEGWENPKGGDVLTTFKANQFKSWDNANPTDSKYISYKKKVSLDKKPEGLQKKNSSGLLAKGRDRMGDNGMRYKKELRDLTLNNEKKEGAYDPRAWLPKVRGGWTKSKIEKIIKEPLSAEQRGVSAALRAIQEFDSPEDFRAHTFYHGTQGSFVGKPSMSIPEKTFDKIADRLGGGYGQRYWAISLTTDKKIASNFGGASDHVNINPVILRKNAKVIEMPKLSDSVELEDHIEQLWNDGVDAVWIGDKNAGEKELAVLNPRAIVNLDAPDSYRQYHLGLDDNPLRIKSDEDFNRIYENAPKYRQELRESNAKFNGLKEKFFKDNYGESQFGLMDKDYGKYKEAKAEWENSKEKEEYEKGKIEYNRKLYETKDKIRFKKKSEVPEDKKLVGLHNLGIDKLRKTIDLGGMPMPSIAVTKKGVPHESYGDITFIMKESAINPGLNPKNKVYQFDAYTPMVPNAEPILKNDAWTKQQIEMISKATGASKYEIKEWAQDEYKGRGLVDDYPKLKDFEYLLPEITEKKMFAGWNSRGGKKYKDYTMNNIIKRMKEQGNQSFFSQFNKMVAQEGGSMQNLDGLRDRKFGPKDQELWDRKRDEYTNAIQEIFEKYKGKIRGENGNIDGYKWDELNRFQELLEDSYSKSDEKWLDEVAHKGWAHSIPEMKIEDIQRIRKILKDMSDVQRPYSEAKPERAIRFDEVGAVVAPEGKLKEVKDMLKDTGLKVYGYKEGERMSVVDEVADDNGLRFKKKVDQTQTPEFKKWFEGSKVVDKSGKPLVMYHGTNSDFNTFDKGLIKSQNWGKGFYFTSNKEDAKQYGKNTKAVYLDVKNPLDLTSGENEAEYNKWYGKKNSPYDGYVVNFSNGDKMVVVKSPNQIKSATDNIGTFDKNNPDIRYKAVWHGSHADFDRFDSSHMSEGEGVQAHGWGHYVAVDKKSAKSYSDLNGGYLARVNEIPSTEGLSEHAKEWIDNSVRYELQTIEDLEKLKKYQISVLNRGGEPIKEQWANEVVDYVNNLNENNVDRTQIRGRNLYGIDIPDPKEAKTPTGKNYLEESGIVSNEVRDVFIKELENYGLSSAQSKRVQKNLGYLNNASFGTLYKRLSNILGSDKKASKFLESLGYDGIHYYGHRDGEAYVIFNDDSLEIKDHIRYKKGLQKKRNLLDKKSNASILAKGRDRK